MWDLTIFYPSFNYYNFICPELIFSSFGPVWFKLHLCNIIEQRQSIFLILTSCAQTSLKHSWIYRTRCSVTMNQLWSVILNDFICSGYIFFPLDNLDANSTQLDFLGQNLSLYCDQRCDKKFWLPEKDFFQGLVRGNSNLYWKDQDGDLIAFTIGEELLNWGFGICGQWDFQSFCCF